MSDHIAGELAMWTHWQERVRESLPNFCAHPIFVDQGQSEEEFKQVAEYVGRNIKLEGSFLNVPIIDPEGLVRDAEYGARVVDTDLGPVTRMWLDSNVELDFVCRHLPSAKKVLDIGAGYGRLAVAGRDLFDRYVCVDAVPISTEISRQYCGRFASQTEIPSFPDFLAIYRYHYADIDVAFNVHSWNECKLEQIEGWLDILKEIGIPHLFTVSHGQNDASIEKSYYTWDDTGRKDYRGLLESRYDLVAEESIGFSKHPHAAWTLKK